MDNDKSDRDRDLPSAARHKIVTELSYDMKLKMEIIESLIEPCDHAVPGYA